MSALRQDLRSTLASTMNLSSLGEELASSVSSSLSADDLGRALSTNLEQLRAAVAGSVEQLTDINVALQAIDLVGNSGAEPSSIPEMMDAYQVAISENAERVVGRLDDVVFALQNSSPEEASSKVDELLEMIHREVDGMAHATQSAFDTANDNLSGMSQTLNEMNSRMASAPTRASDFSQGTEPPLM